ncbi:MAG: adenosylcobalamin-dependent ribonucleoside-diphosphate reductase [Alphaproteobacteria bacterium]|nr:MAG: adenosylcobalamin-dependent ribonucleoside-diphosphate reductase [Alphaproteobacteria bacterium]
MKFRKIFSGSTPYENIKFVQKSSKIVGIDGTVIRSVDSIIVPENWSQTAVDILAQKYARKAGIPKFLINVQEENVPKWLQKSEPDILKLFKLPESDRYTGETDSRLIFHRLAGTWTYWGWTHNYFSSEEDAYNFYKETCNMLATQKAAPNSPQWFNTGLHWAYGITGSPQGHYFVDQKTSELVQSSSAYERPQPHACFIQSIKDDLLQEGGIIDLLSRETRVFKYGSGSGTNFSSLRAKDESLSSGGISSGLLSFLIVFDANAGAIKSGGTTRRSAKMVIIDIDHPDILEYIKWKTREEDKVVFLSTGSKIINRAVTKIKAACLSWEGDDSDRFNPDINMKLAQALFEAEEDSVPYGYLNRIIKLLEQGVEDIECQVLTTDFEAEAYSSVSGQNSNNSVRVGNDFMEKVLHGGNVELIYRNTGEIAKTIPAAELWHEISKSAWLCADPGIQYDTTINDWNTCKNSGRINASNPCSEYMFLDDTACNLASINLLKFYRHNAGDWEFNEEEFSHAVQIWTTILEISITMAQFPSKLIAQRSFDFRTLGLGYANLGALLMQSGIAYDSREGRALAAYITALLHGEAYNTSSKIAKELGPFAQFEINKECMLEVLENHRSAVFNTEFKNIGIKPQVLDWSVCPMKSKNRLETLWNEVISNGQKYGFRNAQVTLLAPTGTIGLLMDCDTLGIEPDFSLVKHKKLSGGGYLKIINNSIKPALESLGYDHDQIKDIIHYVIGYGSLDSAPGKLNNQFLLDNGFSDELLHALNTNLKNTFSVDHVFTEWVLGKEIFEKLQANNTETLFRNLGITEEDRLVATNFACGTGSVLGAPHIKNEHLSVFDCATHGERFISTLGHIKMVAAVQPYLSGAISKTINMPENATIKECGDAYIDAWKLGTKAIALYRDGSKLAQALNVANKSNTYKKQTKTEFEHTLKRGEQEILPTRRCGYTQKVKIAGYTFYHTTGENSEGELKEIFTSGMGSEGAAFRSLMNCLSKTISIGLQHGVPLEKFIEAFSFTKFEPYGPITGHSRIKYATSIVDYLVRDLGIHYLDMNNLAHSDAATDVSSSKENRLQSKKRTKANENSNLGYTGDLCSNCNQFKMRRVGTCLQCESCGTTSGCS